MELKLSQRQERVLRATVRHYIATAEPVGSKILVEEYDIGASPATVRNAMGFLEKVGLLYQPHVSAGRVPSDSGYRVYVDRYVTPSERSARRAEQTLVRQCRAVGVSLEDLLRGAAQILAALSGCIALISWPQTRQTQIRHVQLLQVEPGKLLAIVVTDTYATHSTLVQVPALGTIDDADDHLNAEAVETVDREVALLSNFLNDRLRDCTLEELARLDWQELGREFDRYGNFLRSVLSQLASQAQAPAATRMLVGGLADVLRQPEFSELQQVQSLVHLLEAEQDRLGALIFDVLAGESDRRVRVRIGSENPWEPIQSYTLISSPYGGTPQPLGSVGVLGPTRMDYENAIALVETTAGYLSETLTPSGTAPHN